MSTQAKRRSGRLTPTQARAARRHRRNRKKRLLKMGGLSAIGFLALVFIVALFAPSLPISLGGERTGSVGQEVDDIGGGNMHILRDESHGPYNSVPATSGWHYSDESAPVPWGIYPEAIPDEALVHNLEHGGVRIHYDCPDGCDLLIQQLASLARHTEGDWLDDYISTLDPNADTGELVRAENIRRHYKVVMSPYPNMDTTIALAAWNFIDKFEAYDEGRIIDFILDHVSSLPAPEYFAR